MPCHLPIGSSIVNQKVFTAEIHNQDFAWSDWLCYWSCDSVVFASYKLSNQLLNHSQSVTDYKPFLPSHLKCCIRSMCSTPSGSVTNRASPVQPNTPQPARVFIWPDIPTLVVSQAQETPRWRLPLFSPAETATEQRRRTLSSPFYCVQRI